MNKSLLCFISPTGFATAFADERLIRAGPQVVLDWNRSTANTARWQSGESSNKTH
jgi:hypothetical protein